ncbi:MAG: universal stress protein [Gammaproteobacteria bacterium]|nr:universal stress protein [Gammaproteobacteria bacterium]
MIKIPKQAIIVPIDFSPSSEAAAVYASELATCQKVPLVLLHVVHDLGEAPGYYAIKGGKKHMRKMEDVAKEMIDKFEQKLNKDHPGFKALKKVETAMITGLPVSRILEVVEKNHARMVVMGSQGRTGLAHVLLGSKAEQVVRLCPVPVTIVKAKKKDKE